MSTNRQAPDRTGWLIATAVVLVVAALGLIDMKNVSFSGLVTPDFTTVTQVSPGSPAERAGFEVGDRILSRGGVASDDLNGLLRQPRAAIGETRRFVVERGGLGAPLELEVTFAGQTVRNKALRVGALLIGLAFLLCGVGSYLRTPEAGSRTLAVLGICAMTGFAAWPYVPHATTRLALAVLPTLAFAMMPALLLHFLLRFPRPRPITRLVYGLLYVPVAVASLGAAVTLLIEARLLPVARVVLAGVIVIQLLFAIGVLIRACVRAGRDGRAAYGLNVLLVGFLAGLLPALVAGFIPALPGGQFYFLTTVLLPLALVYAVRRAGADEQGALQPQLA